MSDSQTPGLSNKQPVGAAADYLCLSIGMGKHPRLQATTLVREGDELS